MWEIIGGVVSHRFQLDLEGWQLAIHKSNLKCVLPDIPRALLSTADFIHQQLTVLLVVVTRGTYSKLFLASSRLSLRIYARTDRCIGLRVVL